MAIGGLTFCEWKLGRHPQIEDSKIYAFVPHGQKIDSFRDKAVDFLKMAYEMDYTAYQEWVEKAQGRMTQERLSGRYDPEFSPFIQKFQRAFPQFHQRILTGLQATLYQASTSNQVMEEYSRMKGEDRVSMYVQRRSGELFAIDVSRQEVEDKQYVSRFLPFSRDLLDKKIYTFNPTERPIFQAFQEEEPLPLIEFQQGGVKFVMEPPQVGLMGIPGVLSFGTINWTIQHSFHAGSDELREFFSLFCRLEPKEQLKLYQERSSETLLNLLYHLRKQFSHL